MPTLGVVGGIGPLEIGIVLLIVLIIFGPKRLPELGRSLGSGMRGFKESVTGKDSDDDEPEKLDAGTGQTQATANPVEERQPAAAGDDRSGTAGETRPAGDATR